jgi:Histidine kinase-, DNA gyrase B-, and HSP90-like ATPase
MARPAKFHVDPRLAMLLGAAYRSSEQAIQELVDNAWDADAEHVWISLPDAVTSDPVVVRDDGCGMKEQEVRSEYLNIARDRRASKGDRTPAKHRVVKGRKGIGKFAGLMMAGIMRLETSARGQRTSLTIRKEDLQAGAELEALPLPIEIANNEPNEHGTEVRLSALDQHWNYPTAERLKELLVLEYGREEGFQIVVNGKVVGIEDVRGTPATADTAWPTAGPAVLRLRITDDQQPAKQAGIVPRIGGKIIGRPSYFGLDLASDIPAKVLRRVYGEIEADGLSDDIAGNGFEIIENSKAYGEVEAFVQATVREHLLATCNREMNLAKARLQQDINRSLEKMPEYRREFARRAIERIMQRFYDQPEERIRPIVSVVLDALEHDEYWQVLERIDKARSEDVGALAEALRDFGLVELGMVARQAHRRLLVLDELDALIRNASTQERTVHTALETNLWIEVNPKLWAEPPELRTCRRQHLVAGHCGRDQHAHPGR